MEPVFSIPLSLARRTLQVTIHPTPQTFSERREVLRVLESFGEVNMFRSLKYAPRSSHPNTFITILNDDNIAKDILLASPIRYRLIPDKPDIDPNLQADPSEPRAPATRMEEPGEVQERVFELQFRRSTFKHTRHIEEHPLYGPFKPLTPRYSYITAHLDRVVPDSLGAKGLKDWESDGVRTRQAGVGLDEIWDGHSPASRVASRYKWRKEGEIPGVMSGLRKLWKNRELNERKAETKEGETTEAVGWNTVKVE